MGENPRGKKREACEGECLPVGLAAQRGIRPGPPPYHEAAPEEGGLKINY